MNAITRLLCAIEQGEAHATDEFFVIVYNELRTLAAAKLAHETPGQTLQTTALVHEAYLRLMSGTGCDDTAGSEAGQWQSRAHFFAAAAEAMRRILIESARRKGRLKRGGDRSRVDAEIELAADPPSDDLLALDEALVRLEAHDSAKANVVKLRYFAGMNVDETAAALRLSPATVKRYWLYARAWLKREISKGSEPPPGELEPGEK
jgi:RNA polymerase sigma factor (TIGR02999 family)